MPLFTLAGAQLAYGDLPLLDRAFFALEAGERVGLIGRNGSGKSSLLAVIAGTLALDDGELKKREALSVALVEQEPQLPHAPSLRASLLLRGRVPAIRDERERWRTEARIGEFLHRFGLDEGLAPAAASGGETKRAALALAFALAPDLMLLDEPTNHLDIGGIVRLENLLQKSSAIVVTHDRSFLDRVATRIAELDRGTLRSYPGNFSDYERLKAGELAAEVVAERRFDKFWAEEEAWIRRGIEARRTRDAGRVRRLERLREERAARRDRIGNVKLALHAGQRSGKLVAELAGVCKSFAGRPIVKDLDLRIGRGDRIGLIGANGAGKTTLIKLILGSLDPDAGTVRLGANVQPAYFDQMREALDPGKTVAETISPGSDWVELASGRKHVMSYLADFLFPPRRAAAPVRMLSGGERNRLLLARLFARPANVLVLDEPTNDLDIESLELLEAALQDYDGTLLLVSHDRAFLDNVVTQTLAAEGGGAWKEYAGGYSDWLRQRRQPLAPPPRRGGVARSAGEEDSPRVRAKLSYKETRELQSLPGEIEALEAEQRSLAARMAMPEYWQSGEALRADQKRSAEIEALLTAKLERWEALEAKAKAAAS
ncbi:MAG: ABC transporter ATP-binding protein [Betaproteobacteria bacterium RIFCSPLOWO2_12_FULL_67_28]|nr:MAG: ABC transporter ATP-binding protein [Betaproteobacteria bacterium RIFCSPLOWO2_12_FULL_67_28]